MSHYVDIEIIHTLPYANANRDDAGLPKTVVFGGATRARLSSQALKRAARFYEAEKEPGFVIDGDNKYYRTQILHLLVERELSRRGVADDDPRMKAVVEGLKAVGKEPLGEIKEDNGKEKSGALLVATNYEIERLSDIFENGEELTKDIVIDIFRNSPKRDLALWGRFFASGPQLKMDGAAQVAHAFSTHAVNIETDFFTGMDDGNTFFDEAGAGHPGNAFYESATFYEYANFNVEEAVKNLMNLRSVKGGKLTSTLSVEDVEREIREITREFIESFSLSVPQGKIRSTAHTTLPLLVKVTIRSDRPVNAATAFFAPVKNGYGKTVEEESVKRLANEHAGMSAFVNEPEFSEYVLRLDWDEDDESVDVFGDKMSSLSALAQNAAGFTAGIARDFAETIPVEHSEGD